MKPQGLRRLALVGVCIVLAAVPAEAYVGPGAGFALLSSFLVVFTTIILAFVSLLIWPFRLAIRAIRRGRPVKPLISRFIVVGLDGQDPNLTDRFMAEGKLPNFSKLAAMGSYHRLRTTFPSVSPVAWSYVQHRRAAGEAQHLRLPRPRSAHLPAGAVVDTHRPPARVLKLGRYPHSAVAARPPAVAEVETVLVHPGRSPHLEHGAPRAHHVSPGQVLRRRAERDVRAGPAGHARHVHAVHDTCRRAAASKKAARASQLRKNGRGFEADLEGPPNSLVAGEPTLTIPLSIRADEQSRAHQL